MFQVDQLKSKLSLFDIVNNLTAGIVGGQERKRTDQNKDKKELDREGLFTRMENIHKARSQSSPRQQADSGAAAEMESSEERSGDSSVQQEEMYTEQGEMYTEHGEMYTVDIKEYGEDGQLVDLSKEAVWTQYEKRLQVTQTFH